MAAYETDIRLRAREVLDQLERENRIGIVLLARPYYHDPGLNNEIVGEFTKLGYPVFSQSTLPLDADLLQQVLARDVAAFNVEAKRLGLTPIADGEPKE
jgi:predicted nucleotide-binding protein (sugar kinase/HSP70/actin superfamily)